MQLITHYTMNGFLLRGDVACRASCVLVWVFIHRRG